MKRISCGDWKEIYQSNHGSLSMRWAGLAGCGGKNICEEPAYEP